MSPNRTTKPCKLIIRMKHLRTLRIVLALLFLVSLTLLFLDFSGVLQQYVGWMAKLQFLPALLALNIGVVVVILFVTLLFGRLYCSTLCPLGVMQDAIGHVGAKMRKQPYRYVRNRPWLRYGVLVLFFGLIIAGFTAIAALIAPYSAYGRIAQNLLQPLYLCCNNLLAGWAENRGGFAFHHVEVWVRSVVVMVIAIVTLLLVGGLSLFYGRAWCNNICPVGTLLGFVSRFSIFKPYIRADQCGGCRQCERNCKAGCIDIRNHTIDYSRCVDCFDCIGICRRDAIAYGRPPKQGEEGGPQSCACNTPITAAEEVDGGKRKFLVATAALAGATMVQAQSKKVDGGLAVLEDKIVPKRTTPIKPAGAKSLKHFAQHCTACQLCVAECPHGVLRPSGELSTLMQPEMSYERGYCRPECTRCSEVCPAGAIERIAPVEKSAIHIGVAVWLPDNCVVLTDGVSCGHCASHCPTGAIIMVPHKQGETACLIPSVDETRCIGCGACEHLCPARPLSAIHIEGREVHIVQ